MEWDNYLKHMRFPWESRVSGQREAELLQERRFSSLPGLGRLPGIVVMSFRVLHRVQFLVLLASGLVAAGLLARPAPGEQSGNGGQSTKTGQSTRSLDGGGQSVKTGPGKTRTPRADAVAEAGATSRSVLALPFKRSWEYLTDGMILVPPTVDGERVYQPLQEGRVVCLDRRSGSLLWSSESGGRVTAPVAVARSES